MTRSNPTLAAARAKEQAAHEADQRTIRAAIIARKPHDLDELLEAFGLTEYESGGHVKQPAKGTDGAYVRRLYDAGHQPSAIGRMLGISRSTVWHHIHGVRR